MEHKGFVPTSKYMIYTCIYYMYTCIYKRRNDTSFDF